LPVKVFFLLPYAARTAPSQRFRVEAYFELLDQNNINYSVAYFWPAKAYNSLYKKGKAGFKAFSLLQGLLKRFWQILTGIHTSDFVFIHREAAPVGPPIFEWMVARLFNKKIIYDFDDAIWIPNVSANNKIVGSVKAFWKVKFICKWAYKISAGNKFLGDWAAQYNSSIVYNPTCVDMAGRYNILKDQETENIVLGWTGSHSTLKYLELIKPVLEELENEFDFSFIVICDRKPEWNLKSLVFIPWNEAAEIQDLSRINIGLMPLENDAWSEGKCGFKIIQYLSLGIPAIASPVGVNQSIIDDNQNGYLCNSAAEWKSRIIKLMQEKNLRKAMGEAGRKKMLNQFSTQSNAENFLSLFS
jgi:glycosyltransferase involved in cell wall biosynthesis